MALSASAHRLPPSRIGRVLSPFTRFGHQASAGGLVLIAAMAAALLWANSPWGESYHHLWETYVGFRVGPWTVEHSLHHWINDALMAVFFFLVGLEIKREVLAGELASVRRAALPAAAALGGMVVPAALYAALNPGGEGAAGWGIPMATDIAFALGVLALLGPRVPVGLKVFLTALAIVDDIGAVLVIALFYTGSIAWGALALGGAGIAAAAAASRLEVRHPAVYLAIGVAVWGCFLASGVHATVAGVLMAMTIPARTRIDAPVFLEHGRDTLAEFEAASASRRSILTDGRQQEALRELERASEAAQAPLQRIEHALHPVAAFAILPLFALANAGVALSGGAAAAALANPVALGIVLGLVVGKPLGITLFTWAAVRLGVAEMPEGMTLGGVHAVSWLAGIGFTMSLFIAGLAFPGGALLDVAKVGIFSASLVAGVVGLALVRRATAAPAPAPARRPAAGGRAVEAGAGA
jgi:Na+:H+ antiporter, NhaA family